MAAPVGSIPTRSRQAGILRPALVVLNPAAGRGRGRRQARDVIGALEASGFSCTVRETDRPGHERVLARDGAADGWETVIAAGGDGTVHGAANGLLDAGRPNAALGVVPMGTGNDFAKIAGLAVGTGEAARRLARAVVRRFDVGRVGAERFTNGCGIGFGPAVIQAMVNFPRLRGFPLYVASVYQAFFRFTPPTVRLHSAEWTLDAPVTMVEVAIGTTAGGGFRLTPDARPDDGLLDVCVIRRIGALQFLRYVPRVMAGRHGALPPVHIFRTQQIRLTVPGVPLTAHLDGELRTMSGDTIEIGIEPGRLPVLCAS